MLPNLYSPFSKYLRKKQKQRLPEIMKFLDSSKFDILILQEVFDVQITKKLITGLLPSYPYIQKPIKKGRGIKLSNGIMILSKYPLKYLHHIRFKDAKGNDKMAQKGCVLVEVTINNKKWMIAGTHLNSGNQEIRDLQYQQIKKDLLLPYHSDTIPFILTGDLNTAKNSQAYNEMIALFDLTCSALNDQRPYTYDSMNSWNQIKYNVWIDYLLHNLKDDKILNQYILRPTMKIKNKSVDLADHYAIVLSVAIE